MLTNEDLLIMKELKRDSRQTTRQIGENTKLSGATVHRRMKNLIKDGYITQFTIAPNWNKIDRETMAYILIAVDYNHLKRKNVNQAQIAEMLRRHPFVFHSATITGSKDLILQVRVKDTRELDHFIDYLRNLPGIHQTETLVVLHEATRFDNPFEKPYF